MNIDVPPHPHLHLATISYLFAGARVHRDSLGTEQLITPGGINFMTAGSGIVHGERLRPEYKTAALMMHGVQLWLALPAEAETVDPSFQHLSCADVPTGGDGPAQFSVLLGAYQGLESPIVTRGPLCLVSIRTEAKCELTPPHEGWERAVCLISGEMELDQDKVEAPTLVVLSNGDARVRLRDEAQMLFLAGPRLEKPRFMEWNFISSQRDAIDAAEIDWKEGRFPEVPGDDQGRVELPE